MRGSVDAETPCRGRWARLSIGCLIMLCAFSFARTQASAETPAHASIEAPAETREMNWTRRPVLFSHQTHAKALAEKETDGAQAYCSLCHHPVNGETPYLTCASPGCHDNLNQKDKSVQSYYLATHKKKKETFYSCVSCHEEQAGDDIAAVKRLAGCKQSACHP